MGYNNIAFVIISVLVCSLLVKSETPTTTERPKYGIYAGVDVDIQDYPCYCQIWVKKSDNNTYYCGGTLVANDQIVTAAHCLTDGKQIYVCCGSATCMDAKGKCYHSKNNTGVFVHKGFLQASIEQLNYDDIGYIKVNGSFVTARARPCGLSAATAEELESRNGTVIGCGKTESKDPRKLQEAQQSIISRHQGHEFYKNESFPLNDNYKVIFVQHFTKASSCEGDSGSGLFLHDPSQSVPTVCGIVSFGLQNCTLGTPSVFTHIGSYMDFITNGTNAITVEEFNVRYTNATTMKLRIFDQIPEDHETSAILWDSIEENDFVQDRNSIFDIFFPKKCEEMPPYCKEIQNIIAWFQLAWQTLMLSMAVYS